MAHLVRRETWGDVDLDLVKGHVFVREDWLYDWAAGPGQPPWTPQEQIEFHMAVDRAVWLRWSNRVRIQVRPKAFQPDPAAEKLKWEVAGRALTLTFDVRSVRGTGHWRVNVTKVDPKSKPKPRGEVLNAQQLIKLYSTDLLVTKALRFDEDEPLQGFSVPAHEFGHTMGPTGLRDEWREGYTPHFDDRHSIMNIGRRLRARHLVHVCNALGKLVPGCFFIPLVTPSGGHS